jgi:polyisoprenoid-binding protein YceI
MRAALTMATRRRRLRLVPEQSAVLIEARSNVGPIAFATTALEGFIDASIGDGDVDLAIEPAAELAVELRSLRSGNALYDAELLRRIDARQYPRTVVTLEQANRIGSSDRYELHGTLTFHGVSRAISGSASVTVDGDDHVRVVADHVFDVRDFDIVAPSVLMLRIYPDVHVQLELNAVAEAD